MRLATSHRSILPRERTRHLLDRAYRLICRGRSLEATRRKLKVDGHVWRQMLSRYPWIRDTFLATEKALLEERASGMLPVAAGEGLSPEESEQKIPRDRLYLDTLKWVLEKRLPDQYGQRVAVEVDTRVDLRAVVAAARGRVAGVVVGGVATVLPSATEGPPETFPPAGDFEAGPDDVLVEGGEGPPSTELVEDRDWLDLLGTADALRGPERMKYVKEYEATPARRKAKTAATVRWKRRRRGEVREAEELARLLE